MQPHGLEAYVRAVERQLGARRGAEHVLSPPDFALARAWHAAGVPLAAVLAGIDQAAERGSVSTLRRCRRLVEALAAGSAREAEAAPPGDLLPRLEGLRVALAAAGQPVVFEQAVRRATELLDLAAVAREPNWDYLARKLVELDELVDAAALDALSDDERLRLRDEAKAKTGAPREARLAYLKRRARERFALPRVGGS